MKQHIQELQKKVFEFFNKIKKCYEKCLNCGKDENDETPLFRDTQNRRKAFVPDVYTLAIGNEIREMVELQGNGSGSSLQMKIKLDKIKNMLPMIRKSLFLFEKENAFRVYCWKIITQSKIFEYYMMGNILISLVILAIDSPLLSDQVLKIVLWTFDLLTTLAFVIEMLLKMISYGFLFNGRYSYLRFGFNIIDICSNCLSISYLIANAYTVFAIGGGTSIIGGTSTNQKVISSIKMLRIVRVFKLIERSKSLQAALSAFLTSLNQMFNIILMGSVCILLFSIVGMTYFRGLFYRCDFTNIPIQFIDRIKTKWDCLDYGGEWVNPYPNFDNIKSSFILLFEIMTAEGWVNYMYSAIDATAYNQQPIIGNRSPWVIFFIIYMIFAYFFLLNLAIAILSDNFKKEKADIENSKFKLPIQKEFFKIYKNLYSVKLPKRKQKIDRLSKILLNILDSIYFDVVITTCIISNMIILMINWPDLDDLTVNFIGEMNNIFNYVFIIEAVLKIYVYRCSYFKNGWNILDFVIIIYSLISLLLKSFLALVSQIIDSSIFRVIRVARILRLLKKTQSLNRIFKLFINSIPGVINIALLYFILLFIYSVIGMSIFSYIKSQEVIGLKWNFQNFLNSLVMLIRVTSGEGWNIIMHECIKERSTSYFCKYYEEMTDEEILSIILTFLLYLDGNIGCGTIWAIPYFMSFVILSSMMFLEFFW